VIALTIYTNAAKGIKKAQMDKNYADKIIAEYIEKIFGFALSKTMNTDKAEELASRITFDVYTSLLKSGGINNVNGYIYRVASNVYARFIDEEVRGRRHISLDEVNVPCENDFTLDFEKNETYIRLRKKISYLGRIQREIVVMHYFQRLKQNEIADRLNIPLGTVKWHLHDARNQIKEGMNRMDTMNEKINLGLKPVKFTSMGHSGNPSPDNKDTAYYLSKLISQNIAYAAYREPKTITEIAEELGVSAAFIEDEVAYLEDNGFMDKLPGGKYQTNIVINEPNKNALEQSNKVYTKYAKIIKDKYIPLVFDAMKNYDSKKIYVPDNDLNFLMWLAVIYACGKKLNVPNKNEDIDWSKYRVKHKDGGDYIAFASVAGNFKFDELSYNPNLYGACGDMTRGNCDEKEKPHIWAWQLNTYYDDRKNGWMNNLTSDYEYLYEYITGKLAKTPENADKFKRLFDKGYLVSKGDSEYVNIIISTLSENEFIDLLPAMPEELKTVSKELDEEIFKINKSQYPPRMEDLHRAWSINCMANNETRLHVVEQLVADGTLKPLTDVQKHSVNTILFCDVLPK